MKAGFTYALILVAVVLLSVILFQQRKLSELRDDNSQLQSDNRALKQSLYTDQASISELQRETRRLRAENEELRGKLRQRRPATGPGSP